MTHTGATGLRKLAPELDRIVQALAEVVAEREYLAAQPTAVFRSEPPQTDDPRRPVRPL